jgi:hypothetical protein
LFAKPLARVAHKLAQLVDMGLEAEVVMAGWKREGQEALRT